ncbi:hypothetical protein [Desulfotruncus arcticus]|uniref:hypothetical protein n=1 Tax=Desulfotruncus arcticus TaxID=341036 RepID=UPI000B80E7B9|nr:hypothetical protein [Desulfotruncus arcticus]
MKEVEGTTRKYDYINIKSIILIQNLSNDGYTLDGSRKKIENRMEEYWQGIYRTRREKEGKVERK